jgi:6-phospho-beta-glucosidase
VTAYEDLALEAAVKGGAERVFQALLSHPLVGQIAVAQELTDKLLAHNKDYLPWAR